MTITQAINCTNLIRTLTLVMSVVAIVTMIGVLLLKLKDKTKYSVSRKLVPVSVISLSSYIIITYFVLMLVLNPVSSSVRGKEDLLNGYYLLNTLEQGILVNLEVREKRVNITQLSLEDCLYEVLVTKVSMNDVEQSTNINGIDIDDSNNLIIKGLTFTKENNATNGAFIIKEINRR